MNRDLRWNFIAAVVDALGWGLGFGFVSAATFLPLFVRQLTDAEWAVGLIPAVLALGWYLPGILVARRFEQLPRVRKVVLLIAVVERLPLLLMVPLAIGLGPARPGMLLLAFFLCWAVMSAALGCNSPAYYTLIAKTIPATLRGRMYGLSGALAGLLGVAGGEIGGRWVTHYGFPNGYALCFAAAFVIQALSVIPLGFMREPALGISDFGFRISDLGEPDAVSPTAGRGSAGPKSEIRNPKSEIRNPEPWWRLVRADRNLTWLIASHILYSASLMAAAFYTDYAIRRLGATPRDVGHFTAAVMASQAGANLLLGFVADRSGNRRALQISTVAGVAAAALAPVVPSVAGFYAIFALSQLAAMGWAIASMNFVLELCGPERAASYTAISTLLTGPFRAVMPMIGAALVPLIGFKPVFALAAGLSALSLVALSIRVVEPRSTKPADLPPCETDPGIADCGLRIADLSEPDAVSPNDGRGSAGPKSEIRNPKSEIVPAEGAE